MCVNLMGCSSRALRLALCRRIPCLIYRRVAVHRTLDKLRRLADPVGHLAFDQLLSVEPVHRHLGVCCNDDTVRVLYLLVREHIFRAAGSSCLNLDEASRRFRSLFQAFRRHIRMGDPCGTGCDCKDPALVFRRRAVRLRRKLVIQVRLLLIRPVYRLQKFIHSLRLLQAVHKRLIHQEHGKLAQHIEMDIVLRIRRRDQKDQVHRGAVQRIKIHTVRYDHCRKPRLFHRVTFAVGNGDPFPDPCRSFFLSPVDLLPVRFLIPDLPALDHQGDHLVQRLILRRRRPV